MQTIKSANLPKNPRESANPISVLMFCYALLILFKGRKKTLEPTDLYRPLKTHEADSLAEIISNTWETEVEMSRHKNKEPSLCKVLLKVFGWNLVISGFNIALLEIFTRLTQPLLLAGLITQFAHDQGTSTEAQLYAVGLIISILISVLLTHPFMMGMMHLGMKMRVAMSGAIYRKALRLSKTALNDTTTGQVVNLISNDLGRFDRALIHFHFLWLAPVEVIIATYFMYIEIGVSAFVGIAIMLAFLPLQTYLGKLVSVLRLRTALRTDKRVRMMNEIISGIQVIKMYAWEKPFGKLIQEVRVHEMSAIRKVNYIRGMLLSFEITLTRIATFASLVACVLIGKPLTAEMAFFVTAFYCILRRTVTKLFPQGISQFAELLVSLRRIKVFLMRDETSAYAKSIQHNNEKQEKLEKEFGDIISTKGLKKMPKVMEIASPEGILVDIKALKAKWDAKANENSLDNINLQLKSHQMVAVIGPVGSGKSSLIQAILGELPAQSGSVSVKSTFSYASQEPWLFTGTVRDNILFGLPMDKHRYRTVVKKCALERDFELLPHGDKTIVGERGASLSGGQKARISLARAVYRQADIYLLDDPLSAVDPHVGRHLFDQCMRDYLRKKLVLLVTHQLQFLESADLIVIMDKGKVSAMGTFEKLSKSGLDFAKLLGESEDSEDDDDDVFADEKAGGDSVDILSRHSSLRSRVSKLHSTSSIASSVGTLSANQSDQQAATPMQVQESRIAGRIGLSMYKKYFGAGAGFFIFSLTIFLCIGTQILASGGDFFVSYWVKNNATGNQSALIYYFTAINLGVILFALLRTILFVTIARESSTVLHNEMFRGVIKAAMHFFHVNPSGRILNRFSMDLGQLDEVLPVVMLDVVQVFLSLAGIVIVLCITSPWYIISTAVLVICFYFIREFYLKTSRDVKRLEAVSRSPMYSHLGASINGLSTIRAFGAQKMLIEEYDNYQDLHSSGYFTFLSTSRAFGYYVDLFCVIYVLTIVLNNFFNPPSNPGQIGLAITQAMGMTSMVQWGMRQSAELENSMNSVERVAEYTNLEPEGEFDSPSDKKPPNSWPEQGQIMADDLSMRYFPDPKSDYVLKSLNFQIKSCEKVGIVGRTGAGKSSLINALFRLSYNEGNLLIDKRDTSEIGLHDLRSKISIIPQEPVLFSGTMRYNLDPFEQYSDDKLWSALEEVKLKAAISEMSSGLQSKISEGGTNFSVGQRQLVCLARAILRENRILVMDEATANVDPQTDALIQTTIRSKFKNCTVLTIAHRLHTVMDSDKVLVMDAGRAVEFGSPYELLTASETKIFHGMVMQTGKASFEKLLKIAQNAHMAPI